MLFACNDDVPAANPPMIQGTVVYSVLYADWCILLEMRSGRSPSPFCPMSKFGPHNGAAFRLLQAWRQEGGMRPKNTSFVSRFSGHDEGNYHDNTSLPCDIECPTFSIMCVGCNFHEFSNCFSNS
jgi:hypothetical protein